MIDFMAISGCAIASSGADISIERTAMTPKQAKLQSRLFDKFHKRFRHLDRNDARIAFDAGYEEARRAPAPTEPAVDRDAVLEEAVRACQDQVQKAVSADGRQRAKCCVMGVQALKLATPASPAVPTATEQALTDALMGGVGIVRIDPATMFEDVPAPAPLAPIPDVLFDGMTVYTEIKRAGGHMRTSPENVSEVLDAIVRLMKVEGAKRATQLPQASQPTSAEGKDGDNQSQEQAK